MPYTTINNFSAGIDLRRSAIVAPLGTLRVARNCHISPGGELQKRHAFVQCAVCPENSVGLVGFNSRMYACVKGGGGVVPPLEPFGVGTIFLDYPGDGELEKVLSSDVFEDKIYVVALFSDGAVAHFYHGVYVPTGKGNYIRTFRTKVYGVAASTLYFCAVGDPMNWAVGDGSGSINLTTEDAEMTDLLSLEIYYGTLGVMSSTATQVWIMNADPTLNQAKQTLRQAGTVAPRSVHQYGSGDVLYLAPDGIRSLKARDSSLSAAVSDVGSPLDPLLQELYRTRGVAYLGKAISLLSAVSGRYWLLLEDRIFVLSQFPGPKVVAWTEYVPEFTLTAACDFGQRMGFRDDEDKAYIYGGEDRMTYDSCPVDIHFPYADIERPSTDKIWKGIDAACQGEWDVSAAFNINDETAVDLLGRLGGPSFMQGRFTMEGTSTHCALRLHNEAPGPATLSNMVLHYEFGKQD